MKRIFLLQIFLIFTSAIFVSGQSNSWKNLTPLRSTRADVEKLLGKPEESSILGDRYRTPNEIVSGKYSKGNCFEGWNVPKDTVLSLSVSSKADAGKSFEELKLEESDFSVSVDDAVFGIWTNAELGLQYYFSNFDRELIEVTYLPKKSDNNLRCNGFPPFAPEAEYYPYDKFDFQNGALNKKENLFNIYARLDSFIIETTERKRYKGYILVYFDNKLSLKEYKLIYDKLKLWVFKTRGISTDQITLIEGGLRKNAEIELYLIAKDRNPPAPNPTLPSPQFMK